MYDLIYIHVLEIFPVEFSGGSLENIGIFSLDGQIFQLGNMSRMMLMYIL